MNTLKMKPVERLIDSARTLAFREYRDAELMALDEAQDGARHGGWFDRLGTAQEAWNHVDIPVLLADAHIKHLSQHKLNAVKAAFVDVFISQGWDSSDYEA